MSQTLSPSITRSRLEGPARQRLSLSQRDATEHDLPSPWSSRRMFGLELSGHIRQQIAASRLHGEGYRKLWARLRFAGVRASPRRVRRVMRQNGLLAPHRVGRTCNISSPLFVTIM
jgi:putative transposase